MYTLTLGSAGYPELLGQISNPPKKLYIEGVDLSLLKDKPFIGIVGSRKLTDYGRQVTKTLAQELAQRGVVIVSGLALGIDSVAHQAAIDAGGITLAVLPSELDKVYPSSHRGLAKQIVRSGGALISEYGEGTPPNKGSYVARNRIISGLCRGLLITEAAERSGSLHTANFALEQGRDVMAIPGSIFSISSKGTNNLLKFGATPVTTVQDIFDCLKLTMTTINIASSCQNPEENAILSCLSAGETDTQALFELSQLPINLFNQTLTTLEISGRITQSGNRWMLGS